MTSEWFDNPESIKRVKELLTQAGLPLEMRVSGICRQFVDDLALSQTNFHLLTDKMIYTPSGTEKVLREIDQCIIAETRIEMTSGIRLNLTLFIVIECKHRKNIEIFGFPYQLAAYDPLFLPILSFLTGASLLDKTCNNLPYMLSSRPIYETSILEISDGSTPRRVYEENIVYKAGMSLYDFIGHNSQVFTQPFKEDLIERMGLLDKYKGVISNTLRPHKNFIYSIINQWPLETFVNFNKQVTTPLTKNGIEINIEYEIPLFVYFPIICFDAPIYSVSLNAMSEIEGFAPERMLTTRLRVAVMSVLLAFSSRSLSMR